MYLFHSNPFLGKHNFKIDMNENLAETRSLTPTRSSGPERPARVRLIVAKSTVARGERANGRSAGAKSWRNAAKG
jgi:hypothetical protein